MPTQAERRALTRERLVAAAGAVFADRGYHAATLDEIAERAGVSKGGVYHHFASKQALFATLLRERVAQRLGEVRAVPAAAAGTTFLDTVAGDPRWGPLFFEFVAQAAREESVRPAFAGWLAETREALTEQIAARMDALGAGSAVAPDRLAVLVSALANGMLIEHVFDPEGVPPELFGEGLALLAAGAAARGREPAGP